MKKTLIFSSLVSSIILTNLVISCGPPIRTKSSLDSDRIPLEIINKIAEKTILEFEKYLYNIYGNNENPKKDFYDFEIEIGKGNITKTLANKFTSLYELNKRKYLIKSKYPTDNIKLNIKELEQDINCKTIDKMICIIGTTFIEDNNIVKVGEYNLGSFDILIESLKGISTSYKKQLNFPVRNYWINKKNFSNLWENHNLMNDQKIQEVLKNEDYFTIPNFEIMKPNGVTLEEQINFITSVEDIFGNWFWEMKKTKSFMYSYLSNKFVQIVEPIKRYDFRNFHKVNPKINFCEIKSNENLQEKDLHYCSQLERIKNKLMIMNLENKELEIILDIPLNENYLDILDPENIKNSFKMYFGKIKYIKDNKFLYYFINK